MAGKKPRARLMAANRILSTSRPKKPPGLILGINTGRNKVGLNVDPMRHLMAGKLLMIPLSVGTLSTILISATFLTILGPVSRQNRLKK